MDAILTDQSHDLNEEESGMLTHRALFLGEVLTAISPAERLKVTIKTNLMDDCQLSYESLAKYADVPVFVMRTFIETDDEIESCYLSNIYINLFMLFNLLYTDNKQSRVKMDNE